MGAVAKRVNILPADRRYKIHLDPQEFLFRYGVPLLAAGLCAYIVFTFFPYMKETGRMRGGIKQKQRKLNEIERLIENYTSERETMTTEVEEMTARNSALKKEISHLREQIDEKVFWEDILVELSRGMPDRMWISSLSREKNKLVIRGFTYSDSLIGELMKRLDNSVVFRNAQFISSEKLTEDESDTVSYELKCDIIKRPD